MKQENANPLPNDGKRVRLQKVYLFFGWIFDFTKLVTIVVVFLAISHYFIVTITVVEGNSMSPTFYDGDIILINRLTYRLRSPERKDIISFEFPGAINQKFVKRIIGLPNEQLNIRDGKVFINSNSIEELYITNRSDDSLSYNLDDNEYFVMGDQRGYSLDSRTWGSLPKEYIMGKVMVKIGSTKWFTLQSARESLRNFSRSVRVLLRNADSRIQ